MGVNKIFVVFILSIIAKNANLLPTSYYSKLEIFKEIITNSASLDDELIRKIKPNIGHELDGYDIINGDPLKTSLTVDPEFLPIGSIDEMIPDFPFNNNNNLGTNWDRRCNGVLRGYYNHVHNCKNKGGKCCAQGRAGDPSIGVNWNSGEDKPTGYCGNCYTKKAK